MPQIGQTSHEMADSDVVIPWTALASSQSKIRNSLHTYLRSISKGYVRMQVLTPYRLM